jgi:hypothetical protein
VDAERITGLGTGPTKYHDHIERLTSVQKEILKIQGHLPTETDSKDNTMNQKIIQFGSSSSSSSSKTESQLKLPLEKEEIDKRKIDENSPDKDKKKKKSKEKHKKDKHKKDKYK